MLSSLKIINKPSGVGWEDAQRTHMETESKPFLGGFILVVDDVTKGLPGGDSKA